MLLFHTGHDCGHPHEGLTCQNLQASPYITWSAFRLRGSVYIHDMHTYTLVPRIAEQALMGQIPVVETYMHGISFNPNTPMFAFLARIS